MLEEIVIHNFKSLEAVTIKPGLITVLIGPNGSGKSSILHALTILKQSLGFRELRLNGPFIDLGSLEDLVFYEAKSKTIEFFVRGMTELQLPIEVRGLVRSVTFEYQIKFDKDGLIEHSGAISFPKFDNPFESFSITGMWNRYSGTKVQPSELKYEGYHISLGSSDQVGEPLRCSGGSFQPRFESQFHLSSKTIERITSVIKDTIERIFLVPAIRGFDKPFYDLMDRGADHFATISGPSHQAQLASTTLAYRRDLEERLSDMTERVTGTKTQVRLSEKKKVSIERIDTPHNINIVNEGFGLNQLVQLLLQTIIAPPDSVILIEEPEIHLHPQACLELADLLIEIAKNEKKQIIMTTHNDLFVFRLLTNVAEKKLSPDELSIYFCHKEGKAAIADKLKVDRRGTIEGGLPSFFEASVQEYKRYDEAISRLDRT